MQKIIKMLGNLSIKITGRFTTSFFSITYLFRKKEIRIQRDDFITLLLTWDELSPEQKTTWKKIMYYHFYENPY